MTRIYDNIDLKNEEYSLDIKYSNMLNKKENSMLIL
jgi:hypothetical protein